VDGLRYVLPGLLAFALNKIMLNALNGARRFVLFGVMTTLRYIFMSGVAVALVWNAAPVVLLGLILSIPEMLLFPIVAIACWIVLTDHRFGSRMDWVIRNARFGMRSMGGGMAVELNTRVDILILGLFSSDAEVGGYSFAAFFVEGLLQIPIVVRRFVDPQVTGAIMNGQVETLSELLRRMRNRSAALSTAMFLSAVLLYPWYAGFVGSPELMSRSYILFAILSVGAVAFGTYAVFGGALSQGGMPAAQTIYNVQVLATNMILNLCLAPLYGARGAAIATSVSFAAGALLLRRAIGRHLSIRI
jgi:O-antigen/teichoic acid export membrane protein